MLITTAGKIKKTNWLKRFKAVPKTRNLDQNISDSKSDIWNSYLENFVLDIQPFYIRTYVPVDIISGVSFNFKFSSRKSESQQKLAKKWIILEYSFAQKTSLILRISTHLTLKRICSCNTAKNLSDFTNFPGKPFLFGVREKICTAPFLDAPKLHFWSTLKASVNVRIFLYISIRKFFFQRRNKFFYSWGGSGEAT